MKAFKRNAQIISPGNKVYIFFKHELLAEDITGLVGHIGSHGTPKSSPVPSS